MIYLGIIIILYFIILVGMCKNTFPRDVKDVLIKTFFFSNKFVVSSTSSITRKSTLGDINNGNKQKQMDLDKTLEAISSMNYKDGN